MLKDFIPMYFGLWLENKGSYMTKAKVGIKSFFPSEYKRKKVVWLCETITNNAI